MASIGPISLFREKTSVHNFGERLSGGGRRESFVLRSNRIILELMASHRKEQVVIRGRTVSDTLRLAALVVERFLRDPQVFHRDVPVDWVDLWDRKRSAYDRAYCPDSWVSIHVDGRAIFTTQGSETVDLIEQVAAGEDLTDEIIKDATRLMYESAEDVVVEHESQTAVVFTPFASHLRAAVLERRDGRTGSFSVSAFHGEGNKIRLGVFVNFVADLVEAVALREFLERSAPTAAEAAAAARGGAKPVPAAGPATVSSAQLSAALERKRQCGQFVLAFERTTKVQYRPERPNI